MPPSFRHVGRMKPLPSSRDDCDCSQTPQLMPAVPWRGKSPRKKNPGCGLYGQNQSQDPNIGWDNNATWDNSHFQLGMPAGTNQDAHRQSPPAMVGWDGLGNCCTPPASDCCNMSAQPPLLSITLSLLGFLLIQWVEGARHPSRLPRKSPCRKSNAGNFSIIFCQPGRVWIMKMHFPFHMYFVLKQTNAGRCHSSCSCTLDTSQLKYLLLTLSPTSQNQA